MKRITHAASMMTLCVTLSVGTASSMAADLPADIKALTGTPARPAADVAAGNFLRLNQTMFQLYGDAGKVFAANIKARSPVILALFSGAGGRFILYRPGMPPL